METAWFLVMPALTASMQWPITPHENAAVTEAFVVLERAQNVRWSQRGIQVPKKLFRRVARSGGTQCVKAPALWARAHAIAGVIDKSSESQFPL